VSLKVTVKLGDESVGVTEFETVTAGEQAKSTATHMTPTITYHFVNPPSYSPLKGINKQTTQMDGQCDLEQLY
jgi:hypothetical protein